MGKPALEELLKERILVLDGAMGTMIQNYKLEEAHFRGERFKSHDLPLKGNNDILSLTQPEIIGEIHAAYLEAGADIIETNTFSGTTIAQADYNCENAVYDINKRSAEIAKEQCDIFSIKTLNKPRYVAGAMGPTNKTASISPDLNRPGFRSISFDELYLAYKEQAKGLLDGGSDLLLVETVFDTLNAKAALLAIDDLFDEGYNRVPVSLSGTITDASGRTLSGQTAEAFLISMEHNKLLSIGFNCALGAAQLMPYLQTLARKSNFYVSAYPNAGLPNEMGEYDEGPEEMSEQVKEYLEQGLVNIIGGCCGTKPEHIKAFTEIADRYSPRKKLDLV